MASGFQVVAGFVDVAAAATRTGGFGRTMPLDETAALVGGLVASHTLPRQEV
jgi:hypothetical protein